ncbi:MAG: SLC13 family permease [Planctomycetota bacterium]
MPWEAWLTAVVVLLAVLALARRWAAPDTCLLGGLAVLVLVESVASRFAAAPVLLPGAETAFLGFGNPGLLTVAVLFVVVEGLVQSGAIARFAGPVLGRSPSLPVAAARLTVPAAGVSAFMNNTPVVAMLVPVVEQWARRTGHSASRLLIPLSYASILGGCCTLVGTSTNLLVYGLMVESDNPDLAQGMGLFEIGLIGGPVALIGLGYLALVVPRLLPDRKRAVDPTDPDRPFTAEMIVDPDGPLVGKTIEAAGLRALPGLFLVEIEHPDGAVLPAPAPDRRLDPGDRLAFAGDLDAVVDLRKTRGLVPADRQTDKLNAPEHRRRLVEAVVSDRSPMVNHSIREGRFRERYRAAVLAVARSGQRLTGKLGDVVLRPGDTLLVETATQHFPADRRLSRDFFLVSPLDGSTAPPRHRNAWLAALILAAMVFAFGTGLVGVLPAALAAVGVMLVTRCVTGVEARRSINLSVIFAIGGALGLGAAVEQSTLAATVAQSLTGLVAEQPWLVLLALAIVTVVFTELVTNNAAAVLMFPIAVSASADLGLDNPRAFVMAITLCASASFLTPIGYQTNLMVYGPGGYRFADYPRTGLPLTLLTIAVAIGLSPLIWPW